MTKIDKNGRFVSTFDVEEAIKYHKECLSFAKVSDKFGVSKGAISYAFKRAGYVVGRSTKKVRLTTEQIIDKLVAGQNIAAIARECNVADITISKRLEGLDLSQPTIFSG